jgi:hypothetical protein
MKRTTKKAAIAAPVVPALDEAPAVDFASDLDEATRHARAIFDVLGLTCCADFEIDKTTLNALAEIGEQCLDRIDDARSALWPSRAK